MRAGAATRADDSERSGTARCGILAGAGGPASTYGGTTCSFVTGPGVNVAAMPQIASATPTTSTPAACATLLTSIVAPMARAVVLFCVGFRSVCLEGNTSTTIACEECDDVQAF